MGGRRVWWVFVWRCAPVSASSCTAHPRPPAGGSAAADCCRELGSSTASAAACIVAASTFPPGKRSTHSHPPTHQEKRRVVSSFPIGRWVAVGWWVGSANYLPVPEMPQARRLPTVRTATEPPKLVRTRERPSRALTKLPPNGINASTSGVQVINRRI